MDKDLETLRASLKGTLDGAKNHGMGITVTGLEQLCEWVLSVLDQATQKKPDPVSAADALPVSGAADWPESLLDGTRGRAEVFREALIVERGHCDAWRDATGCKTPDEASTLRKSLACSRDRMRVTAERLEARDRHIDDLEGQLAAWRKATACESPADAEGYVIDCERRIADVEAKVAALRARPIEVSDAHVQALGAALERASDRIAASDLNDLRRECDRLRAELATLRAERDQLRSANLGMADASRENEGLRAELEKTRAELEACKEASCTREYARRVREYRQLREQHEALRAACEWRGVGLYPVESAIKRCEGHGDLDAAAFIRRVQAALLKPATHEGNSPGFPDGPSAAPDAGADTRHDWQHTSSGCDRHQFRCSRCHESATLEGFDSLRAASQGLNPHGCVPKVEPLSLAERNEITVGDSIGLRKPRLAHDIPPPRALSPEEMAQATEEAREFRDNLSKATAGMEGAPPAERRASLREAWAAIEALQRDNTVLWAYVESVASEPWTEHTWRDGKPVSWSEWLAFKALDARKGGA